MKLWGGRFTKSTQKIVDDFNSSIHIDCKMYKEDIEGSKAHAKMLGECEIITKDEAQSIINALDEILIDIENGKLQFESEDEDIHMSIEKNLIKKIGETGKKLHTARSRNDQVALDFRMYQKRKIKETVELLIKLENILLNLAKEHIDVVMPGYTHMQKAQPITFSHHLMAYFEMFKRDIERFIDCKRRTDYMPLGSAALAGTTYSIDREIVQKELGFSSITQNSIDGVSDRDFAIEFLGACSITMMHLSRFCEEIIIWNTNEFGFIEMDDGYSTGSSIMPQKKNPDIAELIRGKTGRVYGDLFALLTVMKGLPLAYNKDMQEDKELAFDASDTLLSCLSIFIDMVSTMTVKKEEMTRKLKGGFLNATDFADYLVKLGLPFRTAHEIAGNIVAYCIQNDKDIEDLTIDEMKSFCPLIREDIYEVLDYKNCVNNRKTVGGPSKDSVLYSIEKGEKFIFEIDKNKLTYPI